jgi:hypothetical protein
VVHGDISSGAKSIATRLALAAEGSQFAIWRGCGLIGVGCGCQCATPILLPPFDILRYIDLFLGCIETPSASQLQSSSFGP